MEKMFLVKFSEPFLHGVRRGMLIRKLVSNIQTVYKAANIDAEISHLDGRIFVYSDKDLLKNIFGVSAYTPVYEISSPTVDSILSLLKEKTTYKLEVKRADKSFPKNSMQLTLELADALSAKGIKMAVRDYDDIIHVEIRSGKTFIYFKNAEIKGVAGFPYASYGKGLVLFSGGFDSPVSAWLSARKGLKLDFLMIYPNKEILNETLEIYNKLTNEWHIESNFYGIEGSSIVNEINKISPKGYKQILMKKAIYYLGSRFSGQRAIITGDSLNQTSTQRQKLLFKIYNGIDGLFLRPLIGMSKEEIIDISKKIGTFELSKKQKEFCSIEKVVKEEADLKTLMDLFNQLKVHLDTKRLEKVI